MKEAGIDGAGVEEDGPGDDGDADGFAEDGGSFDGGFDVDEAIEADRAAAIAGEAGATDPAAVGGFEAGEVTLVLFALGVLPVGTVPALGS